MTRRNTIWPTCRDPSWLDWWISSIECVLALRLSSTTKRALQALSVISANRDISRRCLHKLQEICGHRSTLPSSYIVSGEIVRVGSGPTTAGAVANAWEGTYLGKKVSIRCLKIPLGGGRALKKVRVRYHKTLLLLLKNTCVSCSHSSKRPLCGNG